MADRSNDNPPDPAQMSLGGIVTSLPAVRAAKKANTLSRVHRRLIEPLDTDQDNEARLAFQHTVFRSTPKWLPLSSYGPNWTRGSASCVP